MISDVEMDTHRLSNSVRLKSTSPLLSQQPALSYIVGGGGKTTWKSVMSSESGVVNPSTGPPTWCSFQGVTCDESSTSLNYGSLERIDLYSADLIGSLPSSIGNFFNIKYINMAYNSLTGTIPNTISTMTLLSSLLLDSNSIVGTIPDSIGSLTIMDELSLSANRLTGSIPSTIILLTNLVTLQLNMNLLTGTIPTDFSFLESLDTLNLSFNYLTMGIQRTVPVSTFSQYTLTMNLDFDISNNCLVFDYGRLSATVNHCRPTPQPTTRKQNLI